MPPGIEDIAALLPRAPQQAPLKDYGQIQDQISQTRENNARAQALQQATLEAQRVQQDRIKKQQAWNQAMSQAKDLDDAANQYAKISGDVESAQKVLEGLSQTKAHLAAATNQDLESQVKRDQIITGRLEGIIDPKNPEKTWFEYQRSAPELQQMGVPKFTSPDQVQAYYRTHQLGGTLPKQELENRKVAVDEQRVNTDAAKQTLEARDKDLALAYQDLSAVTGQASYDQWRQSHPDQAKRISPIYNPMMIKSELRKAVPIAKQMELEDKAEDNKRQADRDDRIAHHEQVMESLANGGTADQKNYSLAKREGFAGSFMDWMRERNPRSSTGAERQTIAYYNRMKNAIGDIETGDKSGKTLEQRIAEQGTLGQVQGSIAPNLLQTTDQKLYRQAQRAFTEARLRKESGAAIPEQEFANDSRTYFQQPGDTREVVEQKTKARRAVLDGLRFASGRAYEEYFGEPAEKTQTGEAPKPITGKQKITKVEVVE